MCGVEVKLGVEGREDLADLREHSHHALRLRRDLTRGGQWPGSLPTSIVAGLEPLDSAPSTASPSPRYYLTRRRRCCKTRG